MTVPQITENWVRLTEKFNSKSLKMIDAVKTEVKKEEWLHTNLANEEALEKIMKTGVTGDFLITTTEKTDEYVLYVVFKNKPTRLLIKKVEECFHINYTPFSLVTTLEDLVTTLKKPYPNWPILLGRPIAPESVAPETVV
jgi:glutamine phosphoribosylpyrophosphate amidotransferase